MICLALLFFYIKNADILTVLNNRNVIEIIVTVITVSMVHILKAARLYFAMFGNNIKLSQYIKNYCKVTPVAIVFPWKTGELFRMYCYGMLSKDYIKGIIFVLFDRFIDTLALVSVIILVIFFNGGSITAFELILFLFILIILLLYFAYPGISKYWKRFFLKADATSQSIKVLETLNICDNIFSEIQRVCKGKGIILFLVSIFAWFIEIGGLLLYNNNYSIINDDVVNYLLAAMGADKSYEMQRFTIVSVILMIIVYLIIKLMELISNKRVGQ